MATKESSDADDRYVFRPTGYLTLDELIAELQKAKDSDVGPDGDSPVYVNAAESEELVQISGFTFDWESVELLIDIE